MYKSEIGKELIEKGYRFNQIGKTGFFMCMGGTALATLICLISLALEGKIYFFSGYGITVFGWIVATALLLVGSVLMPFRFWGLHYLGLGQICENTRPKAGA